ncbi:ABC transporter ATPase [Haemophilus paracuniculus]|uniref:ABC transporter ATPase n=1 Tax=Haemophilus paracuniculus TaxID=734 RepID=A0A1T0ASS9_9PAST|nr:ABC transporter ATPase [Haemophilus paracuniculus]OOR99275.1 ABC transporter ATPase [Haemophilus paracuniculus]
MKSLKIAVLSLVLTACVSKSPQFALPEQVNFDGQTFVKATDNQISEMQQLLYLPQSSEQNPNNWQKGILFFLDKNSQQKSLTERIALREKAFKKQTDTLANVEIVGNELRSEVVYPPTERFNDVQLEVSRGRDLACGFGQMQFSDKRSVSAKKSPNLTAYQSQVAKLAQQFAELPWQIECK